MGGSNDRLVNEFTVTPIGLSSAVFVVMIVTPVGYRPIQRRNALDPTWLPDWSLGDRTIWLVLAIV